MARINFRKMYLISSEKFDALCATVNGRNTVPSFKSSTDNINTGVKHEIINTPDIPIQNNFSARDLKSCSEKLEPLPHAGNHLIQTKECDVSNSNQLESDKELLPNSTAGNISEPSIKRKRDDCKDDCHRPFKKIKKRDDLPYQIQQRVISQNLVLKENEMIVRMIVIAHLKKLKSLMIYPKLTSYFLKRIQNPKKMTKMIMGKRL